MLFTKVVEISQRVASTSKRLEKIELLAGLLRQVSPEEAEPVVAFLSGTTRQGRTGIAYAALRDAAATAAESASLEVLEIDRVLESAGTVQGRGSVQRRRELLHSLLARATNAEQQFLTRLLLGDLRQGALEGVMVEALAKAAGMDTALIRRAAMMAGSIAAVAKAALESGVAGLDRYELQIFRPVQPMLAETS
ncbi:MAG: ATP-dependent DNA ligase, partial [Bryobacteraceae bacterium]